jgi:hypothetical protein
MYAVLSNCLELLFDKLIERLKKSRPLKPILVFSSKGFSKQFIHHMAKVGSPIAPMCLSLDELLDLASSLFYPDLSPRLSESQRVHVVEALYDKIVASDAAYNVLSSAQKGALASHSDARARFFDHIASLVKAFEMQSAMELNSLEKIRAQRSDLLRVIEALYVKISQTGFSTLDDWIKCSAQPVFAHIAFVGFDQLDEGIIKFLKSIKTKCLVELYALTPTMHYIADLNPETHIQSQLLASFAGHKKSLQVQLVDLGLDTEAYFRAPAALRKNLSPSQILVDSLIFDDDSGVKSFDKCSCLDAYKMHLAAFASHPIKMNFAGDTSICTQSHKRPIEEIKGLLHWLEALRNKEQLREASLRVYLAHPEIYAPLVKAYFEKHQIPHIFSLETSSETSRLVDSFLFALSFANRRWSLTELVSLFESPFFMPNISKRELIEALISFAQIWKFSSGLSSGHKAFRMQTEQICSEDSEAKNLSFYTFEAAVSRWAKQTASNPRGLIEQEMTALLIDSLRNFFALLEPIRENLRLDEEHASSALLEILNTFFRPNLNAAFLDEFEELRQKILAIETLDLFDGLRMQTVVFELKRGLHLKSVQEKSSGIVICPLEKSHLIQSDITCVLGFDEEALKDSTYSDFKDFALGDLKHAISFPQKSELFFDLILLSKKAFFVSYSERVLGKMRRVHPALQALKNDTRSALFCTEKNAFVDSQYKAAAVDNTTPQKSKQINSEAITLLAKDLSPTAKEGSKLERQQISLYELRLLLSSPLRWYYKRKLGSDAFDPRSILSKVTEEEDVLEVFEKGASVYEELLAIHKKDLDLDSIAPTQLLIQNELRCAFERWPSKLESRSAFSVEFTPLRSTLIYAEQDGKKIAYAPALEKDLWSVVGKVRAAVSEGVIALGKMDLKKQWLFSADAMALKDVGFTSEILFLQEGKKKIVSGQIDQLLQYAKFAEEYPSLIYHDTLDLIVNKDEKKLRQKLFDKAFGYQPDAALAHYLKSSSNLDMHELIEKLFPVALELKEMVYE